MIVRYKTKIGAEDKIKKFIFIKLFDFIPDEHIRLEICNSLELDYFFEFCKNIPHIAHEFSLVFSDKMLTACTVFSTTEEKFVISLKENIIDKRKFHKTVQIICADKKFDIVPRDYLEEKIICCRVSSYKKSRLADEGIHHIAGDWYKITIS